MAKIGPGSKTILLLYNRAYNLFRKISGNESFVNDILNIDLNKVENNCSNENDPDFLFVDNSREEDKEEGTNKDIGATSYPFLI